MANPVRNEEYLAKYLDLLKAQRSSERTVTGYAFEIRSFLRFLEERGVTDLRSVARKDVDDYQTFLYYYRKENGKPYTTDTQITKLTVLRSFFKTLVRVGLLLFNPAQNIEYPRRGEKLPHEILPRKDVRKILSAPDTGTVYGYRDRTMLEVLYSTGIRPMEMAALTVDDVDLDEGFLRITEGKGLKDRTLPLGEIAGKFLAEYIAHVRSHLEKNGSRTILFLTRSGRAFDRSAIHKKLRTYARRCGIEANVSARAFRSTMATDMLRGRADIRRIQEMLGHKSLDTTQIYARVMRDDLKKVHRKSHPRERKRNKDVPAFSAGDGSRDGKVPFYRGRKKKKRKKG
jgi:integrase/recombinase XerD